MIETSESNTLFYPNKMGRLFLSTLEDVLLQDGYAELLKASGCAHFLQKPPAANWAKDFNFDTFSRINQGLETLYGPRGGRRLAIKAGEKFFLSGWGAAGTLSGMGNVALKANSLPEKLSNGLGFVAKQISEVSDQSSWLEEQERQLEYHVARCPVCWNRISDQPVCYHTIGFLQGALHWFSSGLDFRVRQTSCFAMGDERCIFRIDMEPIK